MSFNNLSSGQAERLAMLSEEAGEIVQAVGKILRHGYESRHPKGGPSNRELLRKELADLQAVVMLMSEDTADIEPVCNSTVKRIRGEKYRYTHHQ